MIDAAIPALWSERFGLARSPLFEHDDAAMPGNHHVLLDGRVRFFRPVSDRGKS